jgi:hypothetical protein
MAIKFTCPHCGKSYSVKDQLAGKKAACKDCKKVITIPAATAAPAAVDVEALAAAAFTDEPPPPPVVDTRTIDFECPQCGEPVQQPFELAGKQAPCPSCRRIVKVPMPIKNEPKDWRKIDTRGPSAARANLEPAPEGAWGSATSAGVVSRQALVDAAAIPELEDEATTRRQWIIRGVVAASVLCVLGLGVWGVLSLVAKSRQDKAMARAIAAVSAEDAADKFSNEQIAAVHQAAGEYYLRDGKSDSIQRAGDQFQHARQALARAKSSERDVMLIDLALAQIDLGGDKAEADSKRALDWTETLARVRQALELVTALEARRDGARAVARKLIAKGQAKGAQTLAGKLAQVKPTAAENDTDNPAAEIQAVVALELLRTNHKGEAETLAASALAASKPVAIPPRPGQPQPIGTPQLKQVPVSPSLVALCKLLGKEPPTPRETYKEIKKLDKDGKPIKKGGKEVKEYEKTLDESDLNQITVGEAEWQARQGNFDQARKLLAERTPLVRLRGLTALAGVAADADASDKTDLNAACDLVEGELKGKGVPPWLLLRLIQLEVRGGAGERAAQLAEFIADAGLKAQAQLAVFRSRLEAAKDKTDDSSTGAVADNTAARALAWMALARHNAGHDGSAAKAVDGWEEPFKTMGLAGLALGLQDKSR